MDGSGVNCTDNNKYAVSFSSNDKESHFSFPNIAEVSDDIGLAFKKFNSMPLKTKVKMRVLKALGF